MFSCFFFCVCVFCFFCPIILSLVHNIYIYVQIHTCGHHQCLPSGIEEVCFLFCWTPRGLDILVERLSETNMKKTEVVKMFSAP